MTIASELAHCLRLGLAVMALLSVYVALWLSAAPVPTQGGDARAVLDWVIPDAPAHRDGRQAARP
jgi:hypothetical protein